MEPSFCITRQKLQKKLAIELLTTYSEFTTMINSLSTTTSRNMKIFPDTSLSSLQSYDADCEVLTARVSSNLWEMFMFTRTSYESIY
jgi:hypothetical protein